MNSIAGVLKIHEKSLAAWLLTPWFVVLSSFVINFAIGVIIGGGSAIYTGGLVSLYITMFVAGILLLRDTFPFSLGFSIRRTDYMLGTAVMILGVCFLSALLHLILSLVETHLIKAWGVSLHFFHLPYLSDGSFLNEFWVTFILMVHMYIAGFAITSVFMRFGRIGMAVFSTVALLVVSIVGFVCTYQNLWGEIFGWFTRHSAAEVASWQVPLIVVYALAIYLLLRRATA